MSEAKHQVLLYTSYLHVIGGIETFIMSFIDLMKEDYEIALLCPAISAELILMISKKAKVYTRWDKISCDTLVMIRMMDKKPDNVCYKKSVRMCHACKTNPTWYILQDCDRIIHVSEASRESFKSKGQVIHNPLIKNDKYALLLVSATRVPATDKGRNAERMLELAKMLNESEIPFLWLNFSDRPLINAPKGFINVGTYHNLQPYIARADYLVQLSDQEGFGYSVVEALANNTAVICTPFDTTKELGVKDGKNGYIIPFDMKFDVKKLLRVPVFEYKYDNEKIRQEWKKILGRKKPFEKYEPPKAEDTVTIEVLKDYRDLELKKDLRKGEKRLFTRARAEEVIKRNSELIKILD